MSFSMVTNRRRLNSHDGNAPMPIRRSNSFGRRPKRTSKPVENRSYETHRELLSQVPYQDVEDGGSSSPTRTPSSIPRAPSSLNAEHAPRLPSSSSSLVIDYSDGSNLPPRRRPNHRSKKYSGNLTTLLLVCFVMLGLKQYSSSHATLRRTVEKVQILQKQQAHIALTLKAAEQAVHSYQQTLNEQLDIAPPVSIGSMEETGIRQLHTLQDKIKSGHSQISKLQKHIQQSSLKDAIAKYGAGTHLVELELEFPNAQGVYESQIKKRSDAGSGGLKKQSAASSSSEQNKIVIELAPLPTMPHSVYMFLEMVSRGLFDGCSFILNALHVIKAAPLPYDKSSTSAKVRAFSQAGLESVAFREYNPDYPHTQYSVGFAADGSPSFYINTDDNSEIHVGDPCFGKIVSGIDVVKRLEQAPTRNGIWYTQRIGLKKAKILQ